MSLPGRRKAVLRNALVLVAALACLLGSAVAASWVITRFDAASGIGTAATLVVLALGAIAAVNLLLSALDAWVARLDEPAIDLRGSERENRARH